MGEYVFQEYPKWVSKPSGEQVIVYSSEEERALYTGEPPVVSVEIPQPVDAQEPVENKLIKRRGRPTNAEIAARKAAEQGAS